MIPIEITLNGKRFVSSEEDIARLVVALGLPRDGRGVAVALNGELLSRSVWDAVRLEPGQRVEIVTATQGG
jgi:sulfur carrier protein